MSINDNDNSLPPIRENLNKRRGNQGIPLGAAIILGHTEVLLGHTVTADLDVNAPERNNMTH